MPPPSLSIQERVEIVKLYRVHSCRQTAAIFNARHPERALPLSISTVSNTVNKFNETGSVHDRKRSGRPKTALNEDMATAVLAATEFNPHSTLRSLSAESGLSTWSVHNILKKYRFRPYKMQILHKLKEEDYPHRMNFCQRFLDMAQQDPAFQCFVDRWKLVFVEWLDQ